MMETSSMGQPNCKLMLPSHVCPGIAKFNRRHISKKYKIPLIVTGIRELLATLFELQLTKEQLCSDNKKIEDTPTVTTEN
jgi:hypothetical protein